MATTQGGFQTQAGEAQLATKRFAAALLGVVAAVMAAFTSNAKFQRFYNGAAIWSSATAKKVSATFGGVAADIKAVQVIVIGTDGADAPLTESLPVATVNAAGTVLSVGSFKTITSIEIPAHDGTGATTSLGVEGGAVDAVIPAFTDVGVNAIHKSATIVNPDVPRNLTATSAGTGADVKAIAVVARGLNENNAAMSETLPVFTVDTPGTVVGNKAFKTVTQIDIPPHDGNGATTSVGTGAKLGLGRKLSRNTVLNAYLTGVKEATAPTIAFSATVMESNTASLNSALDGSAVVIDMIAD